MTVLKSSGLLGVPLARAGPNLTCKMPPKMPNFQAKRRFRPPRTDKTIERVEPITDFALMLLLAQAQRVGKYHALAVMKKLKWSIYFKERARYEEMRDEYMKGENVVAQETDQSPL